MRDGIQETAEGACEAFCFICLDKAREGQPLERVCKCPTLVHKRLVAWLYASSAGTCLAKTSARGQKSRLLRWAEHSIRLIPGLI